MRAFLIMSTLFVVVAAGVTFLMPESPYLREIWSIVGVVIIFAAAWSFIGRKKE